MKENVQSTPNANDHFSSDNIYDYYSQDLFPSLIASLPILFRRIGDDTYHFIESLPEKTWPLLTHIYDYYIQDLFHSLIAALPILFKRIGEDAYQMIENLPKKTLTFLIPWSRENSLSLSSLWNQTVRGISHSYPTQSPSAIVDFLLQHIDSNKNGTFNHQEILHLKEKLTDIFSEAYRSGADISWSWWHAWPMMDWKIGLFLWRTCGGFLIVFAILTIIPGRLHGYSGRILRWPILGITYTIITAELIVYAIIRLFIRGLETMVATSKHRTLRWQMTQAKSYKEWYDIAKTLDASQGRDVWQSSVGDDTSNHYNWGFINELMTELRTARESKDNVMALAVLQQCTRKNIGGIMSYEIFSFTNCGEPKHIVKEFIYEVETTLQWVTDQAKKISAYEEGDVSDKIGAVNTNYRENLHSKTTEQKNKLFKSMMAWATLTVLGKEDTFVKETKCTPDVQTDVSVNSQCSRSSTKEQKLLPPIHREKIKTFLRRARAAYGRTCLCLSGGAMMGCYHFGVIKSLFEQDALPHIISGTSAGSVLAAMICTRTDDEIRQDLTPEKVYPKMRVFEKPWSERFKNLYENGCLFNLEDWIDLVQWFTSGDMTFEEAYRKTGRLLCVTISATTKMSPPIVINYISAPDVIISSAVMASAAVPGLLKAVRLKVKDADGNIKYQTENKDEMYWDGSIEQDIPITALSELFNCQFFLASQCNPHIVPFFYSSKGDVGRPSRWSRGHRTDSWRGGFLLSALELYLKSDMRAKFHFLNDIEAAVGFTSTLMTQQFHGTTTIVPQVKFSDYFKLFADASCDDMKNYFQGGSVAAYHHIVMIKLHYRIAHTLDECLASLEEDDLNKKPRRRNSLLMLKKTKVDQEYDKKTRERDIQCETPLEIYPQFNESDAPTRTSSTCNSLSEGDDEYEESGFDGIDFGFKIKRPI